MFNKIKEHFEYKKAKKMVTIMCLNQYNALLKVQTQLAEDEKVALENFKTFSENMSIEDITEFVNNINNYSRDMDNPETQAKLIKSVAKDSNKDNAIPSQC